MAERDDTIEYPDDVTRIVAACTEAGFPMSDIEAMRRWEKFSDEAFAGWLCLPEMNNVIVACLASSWPLDRPLPE